MGDDSTGTTVADQPRSAETISYQDQSQKSIAHFALIDELGIGAFGSVYKAHDSDLVRTVAVKIPRRDQLSAGETEQFLREAARSQRPCQTRRTWWKLEQWLRPQ